MEDYLSKHPGKYFSGTDKPGAGDVSGRDPLSGCLDIVVADTISQFQMFFPIYSLTQGTRKGAYDLGPGITKWWEMVMAR